MSTGDVGTVLVTGAGGFIGSRVIKRLFDDKVDVIVHIGPEDDPGGVKPSNVAVFQADIADEKSVNAMVRRANTVVHLAGPAGVADSWHRPDYFREVHVNGTDAMLRASIAAGVSRFVYVSSAEVYGNPRVNPVTEEAEPKPVSPYGQSKYSAEKLVRAAANQGLSYVILRPFSVYGPGMSQKSLLGSIFLQITRGTDVQLTDLRPIRDYCHVDDLVEAIHKSIHYDGPSGVFNIGSGTGTSVDQLARMALRISDSTLPLIETRDVARANEIFELVADTHKVHTHMNWSPEISLKVGLKKLTRPSI